MMRPYRRKRSMLQHVALRLMQWTMFIVGCATVLIVFQKYVNEYEGAPTCISTASGHYVCGDRVR